MRFGNSITTSKTVLKNISYEYKMALSVLYTLTAHKGAVVNEQSQSLLWVITV